MNNLNELIASTEKIEAKLNYTFKNKSLLFLAFTHCSYINENIDMFEHNERLEFLGDSVLSLMIANYLYNLLNSRSEGELSYLRSRLVEASSCCLYVNKLDIEKYLLLGKGERMNSGRGRDSILSDLFEAIIGAIFIDGGLEASTHFLFTNFHEEINQIIKTPIHNWKAKLQDYCQKNYHMTPIYEVIDQLGPDHGKIFKIAVFLNGNQLGIGEGSSKKEAQQSAAKHAFESIFENETNCDGLK